MADIDLTLCLLTLCSVLAFVASQTAAPCPKQLINAPPRPIGPLKGTEPQVCLGQKTCCTKQSEEVLESNAVRDLKSKVVEKYEKTKLSLINLYDDLKSYFEDTIQNALVTSAKNWTEGKQFPITGHAILASFFRDLQKYLTNNKVNVRDVVNKFFKETFPVLYQHSLVGNPAPLAKSYSKCLKDKYHLILPFGKHPEKITGRISQALEPIQVFLESLRYKARIIEDSKGFNFTSGCSRALLRMKGCSLCKGFHNLKPCHRFCTDVLKNCLSTDLQLQKPWSDFIDASKLLAAGLAHGPNLYSVTNVMLTLHQYIGIALVSSVVRQTDVLTKANKHCSGPRYGPVVRTNQGARKRSSASPTPKQKISLFPKMVTAVEKLEYLRNTYDELVRHICATESPPLSDFENCWNGKDKGRYTVSPSRPTDFQPSQADAQKLKKMVELIQERTKAVTNVTPVLDTDGEGSGASGSGTGNKIPNSGNCGDDEDCGSAESGEKPPDKSNTVDDDETGVYFESTPKPGVENSGIGGNMGASGNAESIRQNTVLVLVPLLFILLL